MCSCPERSLPGYHSIITKQTGDKLNRVPETMYKLNPSRKNSDHHVIEGGSGLKGSRTWNVVVEGGYVRRPGFPSLGN